MLKEKSEGGSLTIGLNDASREKKWNYFCYEISRLVWLADFGVGVSWLVSHNGGGYSARYEA